MLVMPGRLKECLGSWRGQKGNRIVIQIWKKAPLCVMWCLWRERNARNFEDHELGIIKSEENGASNTFLMESFVAFFASFNACGIPRFMCVIFKLKACLCGLLLYTPCVHRFHPLCF
jgi:hypothetical protein